MRKDQIRLEEIYDEEVVPLKNTFHTRLSGGKYGYFKLFVTVLEILNRELVEKALEIISNEPGREEEVSRHLVSLLKKFLNEYEPRT
jgi:hypothetical protein